MIVLEDRITLSRDIDIARAAGARQEQACEIAGIDMRTLQRWKTHEGLVLGDGRPEAVHPTPSHALSADERAALVRVANEPRFADVPPARIVPMLADEGVYVASESTFSRVRGGVMGQSAGAVARSSRAEQPNRARNARLKWAASLKPQENAIWLMLRAP